MHRNHLFERPEAAVTPRRLASRCQHIVHKALDTDVNQLPQVVQKLPAKAPGTEDEQRLPAQAADSTCLAR